MPARARAVEVAKVGRPDILVRPDGKRFVRPFDAREANAAEALAAIVGAQSSQPLYVTLAEADEASRRLFEAAGFRINRRESRYRVPTDPAGTGLAAVAPPIGLTLISAADADVDRLRLLDDALRQDVPGTDGWRWTHAAFREETFGSAFDPATYLVATAGERREYVGIGRVWNNPDVPRLGFIGVLPGFRRRGVARALLAQAFAVLHERGKTHVSTEVDDTNVASRSLVESLGGRRTGGVVELVRRP